MLKTADLETKTVSSLSLLPQLKYAGNFWRDAN